MEKMHSLHSTIGHAEDDRTRTVGINPAQKEKLHREGEKISALTDSDTKHLLKMVSTIVARVTTTLGEGSGIKLTK